MMMNSTTTTATARQELTINLDVIKTQVTNDTRSTISMHESLSFCSSSDDEEENTPQQPQHHLVSNMDIVVDDTDDRIHNHYHIFPTVIGQGQFGKVRKCIQRSTGQTFAVKSVRKTANNTAVVREEIELLQHVSDGQQNNGIVSLVDAFEDEQYFHIVTELCAGGELYDCIVAQMEQRSNTSKTTLFSEPDAARLLYSMLHSVAYLHDEKDIVHRDLKPENFLLNADATELKLIDFGLATVMNENSPLHATVGTPLYMAPEVVQKKSYGKACDIWSMGVIAYILLVGRPPFEGEDDAAILAKVKRGVYSLNDCDNNMSEDAKDFIKSLLKRDPRRRLTARGAMEHPWMVKAMMQLQQQ